MRLEHLVATVDGNEVHRLVLVCEHQHETELLHTFSGSPDIDGRFSALEGHIRFDEEPGQRYVMLKITNTI